MQIMFVPLARPTARRALRSPKRSAIQEYERVSPTGSNAKSSKLAIENPSRPVRLEPGTPGSCRKSNRRAATESRPDADARPARCSSSTAAQEGQLAFRRAAIGKLQQAQALVIGHREHRPKRRIDSFGEHGSRDFAAVGESPKIRVKASRKPLADSKPLPVFATSTRPPCRTSRKASPIRRAR